MEFEKSKTNGKMICPSCRRSLWDNEERLKKHIEKCGGRKNKTRSLSNRNIEVQPDKEKYLKELESDLEILNNQKPEDPKEKKRLSNQKYNIKQKIKKLKE